MTSSLQFRFHRLKYSLLLQQETNICTATDDTADASTGTKEPSPAAVAS